MDKDQDVIPDLSVFVKKQLGFKTCQSCGITNKNVVTDLQHIGGQGDKPITECYDRVACFKRRDNDSKN